MPYKKHNWQVTTTASGICEAIKNKGSLQEEKIVRTVKN